ncbi:MAG: HAD-IIA family hydrolase [Fimbriimonadaceae bacterium]
MIKAVLLDLDGTVYRGKVACPDAPEAISQIHNLGFAIRYLTNNSAARPNEITAKLKNLGIPCEPEWVISSGMVAAKIISRKFKKVAVIGNPGLQESLAEQNLQITDFSSAEAVVVGICHDFNYRLLQKAADAIRSGAAFFATNPDPTYPFEGNRLAPGAGSIVAAVQSASGVTPTMIGKPESHMPLAVCQELAINPNQTIFVGDRLETDILCANNSGCHPWLVLTGVTARPQQNLPGSPTLAGLADYLRDLNS